MLVVTNGLLIYGSYMIAHKMGDTIKLLKYFIKAFFLFLTLHCNMAVNCNITLHEILVSK